METLRPTREFSWLHTSLHVAVTFSNVIVWCSVSGRFVTLVSHHLNLRLWETWSKAQSFTASILKMVKIFGKFWVQGFLLESQFKNTHTHTHTHIGNW